MAGIPFDWEGTERRGNSPLRLPGEPRVGRRREANLFGPTPSKAWRHVDLVLVLSAAAISALGALMILASTRGTDPDSYDSSFLRRQLLFLSLGAVGMVLVTLVDYRRLRDFAWFPYR